MNEVVRNFERINKLITIMKDLEITYSMIRLFVDLIVQCIQEKRSTALSNVKSYSIELIVKLDL